MRYNPAGNPIAGIPVVVKNLLIINGLVFLFKWFNPLAHITGDLDTLLGLHYISSPLFKPWQLLTHMFMHGGFWHLALNMFGLFMLGPRVEYRWGFQRFLTYYLLCGFGAALLYMGWQWVGAHEAVTSLSVEQLGYVREQVIAFSQNSPAYEMSDPSMERTFLLWLVPMVGASGALFGVLLAFGMLYPNVELTTFVYFIPINIKAKWFVILYGAAELFSGVANVAGDNTAHFAHLGGMLIGFFLVRIYERNNTFYDTPWR